MIDCLVKVEIDLNKLEELKDDIEYNKLYLDSWVLNNTMIHTSFLRRYVKVPPRDSQIISWARDNIKYFDSIEVCDGELSWKGLWLYEWIKESTEYSRVGCEEGDIQGVCELYVTPNTAKWIYELVGSK
tara:strand:+ start:116 stop:502 length:387 start_codon:yes stop_codon:yes gene_type:complete